MKFWFRLFYGVLFALMLCSCSSSEKELHVYMWGSYIKPELIERFEREFQCRVVIDTFDSNESMYAKLKMGAKGYDLVFPSNYFCEIMTEQGMIQPINQLRIPNIKYLDYHFLELFQLSTMACGIPYMTSYSGIAYRDDRVRNIEPTWAIFARKDLKGRMTMLNDVRETIGAALKYLGYSINTTNAKEIEAAAKVLINWKKNLAKFESEQYKNGIASAEYLVAQGFNGDVLQISEEDEHVKFLFPDEGGIISFDFVAIPVGAPEADLAYSFINFLLEPDVAAENIAFTLFLSPNIGAYPLLRNDLKNNPYLFPPQAVLKKLELIKNLGADIKLYNHAWDEVRAAD